MKKLYNRSLALCTAGGIKPKALSSFKNTAALDAAIASMDDIFEGPDTSQAVAEVVPTDASHDDTAKGASAPAGNVEAVTPLKPGVRKWPKVEGETKNQAKARRARLRREAKAA